MSSINTIMNHYDDKKNDSEQKHSYSCKRCRRLKKKCSRSIPECLNCKKAKNVCEYVPRAPRRKKVEVLRTFNEFRSNKDSELESKDYHYDQHPIQPPNLEYRPLPPITTLTEPPQSFPIRYSQFPIPEYNHSSAYNSISSSKKSTIDGSDRDIQQLLQEGILNSFIGNSNDHLIDTNDINIELDYNLHYQCVDSFFSTFGRYLTFMNKKSHLERFQSVELSNIDKLHPKYSFDLYLVFYLGYCVLERHNKISGDEVFKKYLVKKSIGVASKAINFSDLTSVRYLLLLAVYSVFDNSSASTWHISGILVRLTLNLGLHQKNLHSNNKSEYELEMEKRLFWSVYNFDRWISGALVRQNSFEDDDINIDYPSALPGEDPLDMASFRILLSLRKLEGQILKSLHSANSSLNYPTLELKQQLMESFRVKIEEWFSNTNSVLSAYKRALSHYIINWHTMSYNHLLAALYSPSFLIPNPSEEILKVVSDNCLQYINICSNIHQLQLLPLNWVQLYKYLHVCLPLFYCLCHESADLIETQKSIVKIIEVLSYYSDCWPTAVQQREIFVKTNTAITNIKDRDLLLTKLHEYFKEFTNLLEGSDLSISYGHPVCENK